MSCARHRTACTSLARHRIAIEHIERLQKYLGTVAEKTPTKISRTTSCKRSQVDWTPGKARREASVSHSGWRPVDACSVGNRHQPAPFVSLHVEVGVILTAKAPNRRRSSQAFSGPDDTGPRSPHTGEKMDTTTLLVIVLVVLLLGGGGFFYRRRA
jgi:LPXTG-motif cell wall-anchored protein